MNNKQKYYELSKDIIKTKGDVIYNYQNYNFESREICEKIFNSIKNEKFSDSLEFFEDFDLKRRIKIMFHFPEIHIIYPIDWLVYLEKMKGSQINWFVNKISTKSNMLPKNILSDFSKALHTTILNFKPLKVSIGTSFEDDLSINVLYFLDKQNIIMNINLKEIVFTKLTHYSDTNLFILMMKNRKFSDCELTSWLLECLNKERRLSFDDFDKDSKKPKDLGGIVSSVFSSGSSEQNSWISSELFEYMVMTFLEHAKKPSKEFKNIIQEIIFLRWNALPKKLSRETNSNKKGTLNEFIENHISSPLEDNLMFAKEGFAFDEDDEYDTEFNLNYEIKKFNKQIPKLSKTSKEYGFSFDKIDIYIPEKKNHENIIHNALESLKKLLLLVLLQKNIIKNENEFNMKKVYSFFKRENVNIYAVEFIEQYYGIINSNMDNIHETLCFIRVTMTELINENITLVKNNVIRKPMSPKSLVLRKLSSGDGYMLNYSNMDKTRSIKTDGYLEFIWEKCAGLEKIVNKSDPLGRHYKMDENRDYSEKLVYEFFEDVEEYIKIKILNEEPHLSKYMTIDWEKGLKKIGDVSNFSNLYILNKLSKENKEIINQKIYKLKIPRNGKYIIGSSNENIWLFLLMNDFEININIKKIDYIEEDMIKIYPYSYISYCIESNYDMSKSIENIMLLANQHEYLPSWELPIMIWDFLLIKKENIFHNNTLDGLSNLLSFFYIRFYADLYMKKMNKKWDIGAIHNFIKLLSDTNSMSIEEIDSWIEKNNSNLKIFGPFIKNSNSWYTLDVGKFMTWWEIQIENFMTHAPMTVKNIKTNEDKLRNIYKYYFHDDDKGFETILIIHLSISHLNKKNSKPWALAIMLFIDQYYEKPIRRNKKPESIS